MTYVMDASFALDLMASLEGPGSDEATRTMAEDGLLAPVIFWHEVASGLRNMMLRRAITSDFRFVILERIRALRVATEPVFARIEAVMQVSDRYQLTTYDAAYLEIAIRTDSGLATFDSGLIGAAPRAGVRLVLSE